MDRSIKAPKSEGRVCKANDECDSTRCPTGFIGKGIEYKSCRIFRIGSSDHSHIDQEERRETDHEARSVEIRQPLLPEYIDDRAEEIDNLIDNKPLPVVIGYARISKNDHPHEELTGSNDDRC